MAEVSGSLHILLLAFGNAISVCAEQALPGTIKSISGVYRFKAQYKEAPS
jgi:hypothetical protein